MDIDFKCHRAAGERPVAPVVATRGEKVASAAVSAASEAVSPVPINLTSPFVRRRLSPLFDDFVSKFSILLSSVIVARSD